MMGRGPSYQKLVYYVRPDDENEGGSVVDVFGKREYLASGAMFGPLTKTRVVRWLIYLENGRT